MYEIFNEQMVNTGVYTKLSSEEEYWLDSYVNKTYDETNVVGDKVKLTSLTQNGFSLVTKLDAKSVKK